MGTKDVSITEIADLIRDGDLKMRKIFNEAAEEAATWNVYEVQEQVPYDTGALQASVHLEQKSSILEGSTLEIVATAPYATISERGRYYKSTGTRVPGRWMRRSVFAQRKILRQILNRRLREALA